MKTHTAEIGPRHESPPEGKAAPESGRRVAAPDAAAFDVSIGGNRWRACLKEIGYWWYDW